MYLVRGGDGQMRTIMATSYSNAAQIYLHNYPACVGDEVSVKKREVSGWHEYEVREPAKPRRPAPTPELDYTKTKAR